MAPVDPMDLVRSFYAALNQGDVGAMAACLAPDCIAEQVFLDDDGVYEGRDTVCNRWHDDVRRHPGAFPGGHRVEVDRIAGLETGWGWVQADWRLAVLDGGPAAVRHEAGSTHFWIEGGLIRRVRSVRRTGAPEARPGVAPRTYPTRPIVGIGAVIFLEPDQVVLVKRLQEPLAGQWSLPGGALEVGETLEAGVRREVLEETGLVVDVGPMVETFDRILVDEAGRVRYHFVLVDYACAPRAGTLRAGGDVADVVAADVRQLETYRVTEKAQAVIARAQTMRRSPSDAV
jgi:8-oxo-dGTP diphosphatase